MSVRIVVVSHSEKIAEGAVELAAQMAPDVMMAPAGGTSDGRIGTSLEKVMAALEQVEGGDGVVVLTDLGSAVMTAESALEFAGSPPGVLLADAPLVEGLVAAAVAAQSGADVQEVRSAAEAGAVATDPLVARKGRASYLGERSAGHRDPGAASSALILRAAAGAAA